MWNFGREESVQRIVIKEWQIHSSALVENMICNNRIITVTELQHDLNLSHGILVNMIQDLGFNKVCTLCALITNGRSQEPMNGLCCVIFAVIFCQWSGIYQMHCHRKWVSSEYPGDKTPQHGLETQRFSMIRKVQDREVHWQSDGITKAFCL
jgi:hypothetical protein